MRLPSEFDLHALEVFILTVDLGGMTPCALRLNVTQSAVSQTIARLESGLGAALFDRSLRPLGITPAGRSLYVQGLELLSEAKRVYDGVREESDQPIDSVTIAMSESLATHLTAPLLKEYGNRANRWTVRSGLSLKHHAEFLARRFDMLVTGSNMLERETGLDHRLIVEDPFVLLLPSDYDGPTEPGNITPKLPFIRYTLDSGTGQRIEQQLTRMRLRLPNTIEVEITHQQLTTVALGMGWSITSLLCLAAQPELMRKMRVEPLRKGHFSRRIEVISRAGELGDLAECTTKLAQSVLQEQTFPPLTESLPWVEELIRWT
ncbi:MAG: LysR substrate-binding domain-containing protein [Novosphingobium sp.]|uniref:LysR substrate-binding domain-containing protein n=1 Tax=Novosphingobium sp. TaxID=1874826 RepID=UPI003B9BF829